MDDIFEGAEAQGLQDLVVLVINSPGNESGIDRMDDYQEGFQVPILQDTDEVDVFGQWDANSYDLYIIDRAGRIAFAESHAHPADDLESYIEQLAGF